MPSCISDLKSESIAGEWR
jgi:hypothetical protein